MQIKWQNSHNQIRRMHSFQNASVQVRARIATGKCDGSFVSDGAALPSSASCSGDTGARCVVRRKPFFWDISLTTVAEFTVMGSSLLLISLLGRWLGPVALAEYLLLRRVTVWFMAGSRLGLATALPRYVAWSSGQRGTEHERHTYFFISAAFMMLTTVGVATILVLGRRTFAEWLFGSRYRSALVIALALLLIGLVAQSAVYGYYRGLLDMVRANLLQVVNLTVMPLTVLLVLARTGSIPIIVGAIGGVTAILSVLFALPVLRKLTQVGLSRVTQYGGELLRYGIPRMPGDFGIAALLAVGPVVAAHEVPMAKVSSLLLGVSILTAIGYAVSPIGVVLLSKVSMMLGGGAAENVRSRLRLLAAAVPEMSVFVCAQLFVFADVAVRTWVGSKFLDQVGVIRLLILAIPPYLFYVVLRSTIDAADVTPYNARNVLIGLAVHLVLLAAVVTLMPRGLLLEGIAGSLLVAFMVLGFLTERTFCRLYKLRVPWRRSAPAISIALGFGCVAWVFRFWHGAPVKPLVVVAIEAGFGLAYLAILRAIGSTWLQCAGEMAFHGRAS